MSKTQVYSFPFSCSLAVKIVLTQHNIPFETLLVDRGPGRKVGGDFDRINPKRKVPTLIWKKETLTEIVAILFELDQAFEPERTSGERRTLLEHCSFVSTELHQQVLGSIFDLDTPTTSREDALNRLLPPVLKYIESQLDSLGTSPTLIGNKTSGADAYTFWALLLLRHHNAKLIGPASARFLEHMSSLAFVRSVLASESKAMAENAQVEKRFDLESSSLALATQK